MTGERSGSQKPTLYLFPDTNVFIQCCPLNEVDWSEWADYEEIHLIVCRPVQREMDKHKSRGNDRVGKRARKICSRFRQIILSEQDLELIRQDSPRVLLSLEAGFPQSSSPLSFEDYNTTDDQLVGCVHEFRLRNEGLDVRLLTHDTGPMMTSKGIGLPFVCVPESWLLAPELTKEEKETRRLRQENARLKHSEPRFLTRFLDDKQNEVDSIQVQHVVYEPLTGNDLTRFINLLEKRFPAATDFGPRESVEQVGMLGLKTVYEPAQDAAIRAYTARDYPAWIEECKKLLSELHKSLQRHERFFFFFGATNEGIRPAKNVLVIISSRGDFLIRPPQVEEERFDGGSEVELQLPDPPSVPRGEWKSSLSWLQSLGKVLPEPDSLKYQLPALSPGSMGNMDARRDPDAFYYKPGRSNNFDESFMLECEQWRHATDEEIFQGEMYINGDRGTIAGALECEIHAENLPTPSVNTIPVRITVRRVSVREYASDLVSKLIGVVRESG